MTNEFANETSTVQSANDSLSTEITERLTRLTRAAPIMLFMKGTPQDVTCKFSRQMVDILDSNSIVYGSFDILTDEGVRQGLKSFSKWNTYPQLYARGNLVGGLDVVKELVNKNTNLSEYLNGGSSCCQESAGSCASQTREEPFQPCSSQCACAKARQQNLG